MLAAVAKLTYGMPRSPAIHLPMSVMTPAPTVTMRSGVPTGSASASRVTSSQIGDDPSGLSGRVCSLTSQPAARKAAATAAPATARVRMSIRTTARRPSAARAQSSGIFAAAPSA